MQKIMISIICLMIFTACLNNGLSAREWSEPIRLTHHQGERMQTFFKAQMTLDGNIHILYHLEDADGERNNDRDVYQAFDVLGNPISEGLVLLADSLRSSYSSFYVDQDNELIHFISFGSSRAYYYMSLGANGDTIVPPRNIELLTNARNEYLYFPNGHYGPYLFLNQNNDLIYGLVDFGRDDDVPYFDLTYSLIDTSGQVIDSIITVHRFDQTVYRDLFEVDVHGNIYFCSYVIEQDGNHPYLTKIDPEGDIIEEAFRLQPYYEDSRSYDAKAMYVDENENVYFGIVEWSPRGTIIHGQKLNRDFEVEFDIALCTSRGMNAKASIAGEGDEIALYCNAADEGPDQFNSALMTFNTDGEILDSVEYFEPEFLLGWKSFLYNGDFYLLYMKELDGQQFEMYLKRSLDNNDVVTDNRQFPYSPTFIDAYPNPFNDYLTININTPFAGHYELDILDLKGRRLFFKQFNLINTPSNTLHWDGRNQTNQPVATGTYFIRLIPPHNNSISKKKIFKLK